MNVFWSGTDLNTIAELGGQGWMAATVFNQKQEMLSAYCQILPAQLFLPEIETYTSVDIPEELTRQWDEEYDKHVVNKEFSLKGHYSIGSMPGSSKFSFPASPNDIGDNIIGEVESEDDLPPGFFLESKHYPNYDNDFDYLNDRIVQELMKEAYEAGEEDDEQLNIVPVRKRQKRNPRRKNKK